MFDTLKGNACAFLNQEVSRRGYMQVPGETVFAAMLDDGSVIGSFSSILSHAEIRLINQMNMNGIDLNRCTDVFLMDAVSYNTILPCSNCINYLLSIGMGKCRYWINEDLYFRFEYVRMVAMQGMECPHIIRSDMVYSAIKKSEPDHRPVYRNEILKTYGYEGEEFERARLESLKKFKNKKKKARRF